MMVISSQLSCNSRWFGDSQQVELGEGAPSQTKYVILISLKLLADFTVVKLDVIYKVA